MSRLNDLFKVVAEGKKAAIESNPGKKRLQDLKEDLHGSNPFLTEGTKRTNVKEPTVSTARPTSPPPAPTPASQIHSQDEIIRALKVNATFQQPEPESVALDPKAVQTKLKFLEQAIGKIAATGPGSGEVRLRYLDDVDRGSISDGRILKYDEILNKFVFTSDVELGNVELETLKIGDIEAGNYSEFEADGTMVAKGDATCFRDELQDLVKAAANNPASRLAYDFADGSLVYKINATVSDYAVMNIQINHDWKLGTPINPHIHWNQTQNNTPNWLIQYRWQANGESKTVPWISVRYTEDVFTYVSGSLNQITSFGFIDPPIDASLSDIVQMRIIRDTANASGLFAGPDPYTIDAPTYSFDIHIQIDTLGSRQTYVK